MELIEKIHIIIIMIVNIILLFLQFIFILYSNKNIYLINRYPNLLLFVTLPIVILCDIHLLNACFGNKIHHLIYFDLQNICTIVCISIYTYRGIFIYLRNNKKKVLLFRMIFLLINLLFVFYIISINVIYYNTYFEADDWQNYPLWIIYSSYLFIFHPLIIYLLNNKINKEIRNDYIYSMIILICGFILELVNLFYHEFNNINNYKKAKYYIHFFTTFLTCISYSFIPLVKYYFDIKSRDINDNNTNNDIININKKQNYIIINNVINSNNKDINTLNSNVYKELVK